MESISTILRDEKLFDSITREMFSAIDLDHSGNIEKTELKKAMTVIAREIGMYPLSDQQLDGALAVLDEDGNGELSHSEFKILVRALFETL
ncbi:unnamed protein product [Blepharisma stoltei]|uniref:EF-hand domain-containing protein n=1 Tax=Blepharisma stoltei TaxID=1481888 RepID=A0AAU9J1L2_9CILI|nr:unnamed protein product [Blepharisma stoltei]